MSKMSVMLKFIFVEVSGIVNIFALMVVFVIIKVLFKILFFIRFFVYKKFVF